MIGAATLNVDRALTSLPFDVNAKIASMCSSITSLAIAYDVSAFDEGTNAYACMNAVLWLKCFSASLWIVFLVSTASSGKSPDADSPESIVESVPSSTAQFTSETSALVGLGFSIIESSICVATTTGSPNALHLLMISCS